MIKRLDAERLAQRLGALPPGTIAEGIEQLIVTGELQPETRLPTVRQVADVMGTSVGSVAKAWALLRDRQLIDTRRRGGTVVSTPTSSYTSNPPGAGDWRDIDLAFGSSDPALLPDLVPFLASGLKDERIHSVVREDVTRRLVDALEQTWPFRAEAWTTAGGGTEGLLLAIAAAAPRGSTVLVDEPVVPSLLDTLSALGLTALTVQCDDEGPVPTELAILLDRDPAAFIYQAHAPFSTSHVISAERAQDLVSIIRRSAPNLWLIEDDSFGPLASTQPITLGAILPNQTVCVRSYCRAYGVDLRTSVIGGSGELVAEVRRQRSHGTAVNSRILQNALADLLTSNSAAEQIRYARDRYRHRHKHFTESLEQRSLSVSTGPDSYVVWVQAADPAQATAALARHGVLVTTGERSYLSDRGRQLLRIVTTRLPDDPHTVDQLADLIAHAVNGQLRDYFD